MEIKLTPIDLVKRGLWDKYLIFVNDSSTSPETILKENKPITLTEDKAYLIGLLSVIETHNIPHLFRTTIISAMKNKCIKEHGEKEDKSDKTKAEDAGTPLVKKQSIIILCKEFDKKFPPYWSPEPKWERGIEEYRKYAAAFLEKLEELPTKTVKVQNIVSEYVRFDAAVKLLPFLYFE